MTSTRRAVFFPIAGAEHKPNCKRVFRIERDGTVIERAYLDVPDPSEREKLICIHYLRHMTRHFLNEDVAVRILSRDAPWDFRLQLSNGTVFNLEVTAIADSARHHEINKREETLAKWSGAAQLSIRQLEKLNYLFPNRRLAGLIEQEQQRGTPIDALVDNPIEGEEMHILLSNLSEPSKSLAQEIQAAIEKKSAKGHAEKRTTVLIIDNRTMAFGYGDYVAAAQTLKHACLDAPFPEIWFYTGYYSDLDGNNAEFSFAPLKISEQQRNALKASISSYGVDEAGRLLW